MDQLQGVRTLIDRLGLPPRLKMLVTRMEEESGPLELVGTTPGGGEVRRIQGMVDGQNLLASIVAAMLNHVPVDEEELRADGQKADQRTAYDRWIDAAEAYPQCLVLWLEGASYVAFDGQAERLIEELGEHPVLLFSKTGISLPLSTQASWSATLADRGLEVYLVAEQTDPDSDEPYDVQPILADA